MLILYNKYAFVRNWHVTSFSTSHPEESGIFCCVTLFWTQDVWRDNGKQIVTHLCSSCICWAIALNLINKSTKNHDVLFISFSVQKRSMIHDNSDTVYPLHPHFSGNASSQPHAVQPNIASTRRTLLSGGDLNLGIFETSRSQKYQICQSEILRNEHKIIHKTSRICYDIWFGMIWLKTVFLYWVNLFKIGQFN